MGRVSTCQIRSLTMNHILTSAKVSGLNLTPDNQTSKFQTISFHPWGLMPMTPQSTDSQVPQPIYFSLVRYSYFRSSQLSHKIHSEQPLHTVVTIHHLIHAPALPRRFWSFTFISSIFWIFIFFIIPEDVIICRDTKIIILFNQQFNLEDKILSTLLTFSML